MTAEEINDWADNPGNQLLRFVNHQGCTFDRELVGRIPPSKVRLRVVATGHVRDCSCLNEDDIKIGYEYDVLITLHSTLWNNANHLVMRPLGTMWELLVRRQTDDNLKRVFG